MTSSKATVAFFGATGGCAGYCLAAALKAGHSCTALARTPGKLRSTLEAKHVSPEALSRLHIVQGDARDQDAVTQTLRFDGKPVDVIVTGIGSLPALQWSFTQPVTAVDSNLCGDAADVLVRALKDSNITNKPLLAAVSTTGISPSTKPRDIPLAYYWLYKWLLHIPHIDKQKMESTFAQAALEPATSRSLRGFIAVKPTLLMDGPAIGLDKIRHGTEDEPAIGYTIRRHDVGEWLYANLIAQPAPDSWIGKGISLTS